MPEQQKTLPTIDKPRVANSSFRKNMRLYRLRQEERGVGQLNLWVPNGHKEKLKLISACLRENPDFQPCVVDPSDMTIKL